VCGRRGKVYSIRDCQIQAGKDPYENERIWEQLKEIHV